MGSSPITSCVTLGLCCNSETGDEDNTSHSVLCHRCRRNSKASLGLRDVPVSVPFLPCPPQVQSIEDRKEGSESSLTVNFASLLFEGLQGQLPAIVRLAGNSQELAVGMSDDVRRRDSPMYTEFTRLAEELREKKLLTHREKIKRGGDSVCF